jgi:hypothetical protein
LPGYTFMGIHKEVRKLFGSSILNYIISARTAQGYEHWKASTPEERLDIINRWNEHKSELQSERQRVLEEGPEGQETGHLSPKGFLQTRHLSFEERKKLHEDRRVKREQARSKTYGEQTTKCPFCRRAAPHKHNEDQPLEGAETPTTSTADVDREEFEQAIKASVAATSRGNPEEDFMIERAIRASVRELQRPEGSAPSERDALEHDALERAIKASVAEAARERALGPKDGTSNPPDPEFTTILEKSLQASLRDSLHTTDTEKFPQIGPDTDEDDDVKRALEASRVSHEEHLSRTKTEEEIVMEYVKRQSLVEEEHKRAMQKGQMNVHDGVEDDSDLKRALEESLKLPSTT